MDVISIIISAGKSSVDVVLYTLLPIMVVMLIIMKYLSVRGILDVIVRWLAPWLKPFGLTGMSAFLPHRWRHARLWISGVYLIAIWLQHRRCVLPWGRGMCSIRLFRYVIPAALIGILIRTVLHIVLF